jgi:hypothetical protein
VKGPVRKERRGANVVPISRAHVLEPSWTRLNIGGMSTRLMTAAEVAELLGVPPSWV